jgi:hypothetical protein
MGMALNLSGGLLGRGEDETSDPEKGRGSYRKRLL